MDIEEDVYYYTSCDDISDGAAEYSGDDESGSVMAEEVEACTTTEKHYTILKEETMKQLQQNDISEVSNVLAVTRGIACTLLLRHRWSVASVFEEWFADEDKLRAAVGISTNENRQKLEKTYCKICMETIDFSRTLSASCGHLFCSDCWAEYVAVSINDGAACLTLRCPEPKCAAVAGLDIVEAVAEAEDEFRFHQYLFRSYVESSRNRKWCPRAGCEFAVEFDGGGGEEKTYDVMCDCSYKFCWRCTEEQHRPVGCDTVAKWAEKNSSDADNNSWISAFTKPCPKCNKKIEKSQGCNHMTCQCRYEFCWHCLGRWEGYNGHACNQYSIIEEENSRLNDVRAELRRYSHYYERWLSNHKSREIAQADAARAKNELLPKLSAAQELPETEMQFVVEAWDQIIECRRVLKWSYAYGYYVKAEEKRKKEIFEFLQGEAERSLERLHRCAEKESKVFGGGGGEETSENFRGCRVKLTNLTAERSLKFHRFAEEEFVGETSENFRDFKVKLTNLTAVTKRFFENLVRALENDLSEVGGDRP